MDPVNSSRASTLSCGTSASHDTRSTRVALYAGNPVVNPYSMWSAAGRTLQDWLGGSAGKTREEKQRKTLLGNLQNDLAHFLDCHARNLQPATDPSGLRMLRSMEPILASLNARHEVNLVYCENQQELGALFDSIMKSNADWRGGVLAWMHGSVLKGEGTHFIGMNILKQGGTTVIDVYDSTPDDSTAFDVSHREFEKIVLARARIHANYHSIPVQVMPNTCGFHSIHFIMSQYRKFTDEAGQWIAEAGNASTSQVTVKRYLHTAELIKHAENQNRLKEVMKGQPLTHDTLPPVGTVGEPVRVKEYFSAHKATKTTQVGLGNLRKREYEYSDSIERYILTLLNGAVDWVRHTGAARVAADLAKVRPQYQGKNSVRYFEPLLPSKRTDPESLDRQVKQANSSVAQFWTPPESLPIPVKLPANPSAAYIPEWPNR
jgi:hypothetical protein